MSVVNLSAEKLPLSDFPNNLKRNIDPKAPPPFRDMGAKGLIPGISPEHLAMVLFQLQFDPVETIRETAQQSFKELPTEMMNTIAKAAIPAPVLDFCARRWLNNERLIQFILTNNNTADETFAFVANKGNAEHTDLIGNNQVRILRSPAILEQLYLNPNTRQNTIDRAIEIALREKIDLDAFPALKSAVKAADRTLVEEAKKEARLKSDKPVEEGNGIDGEAFAAILKETIDEEEKQERIEAGEEEPKEEEQKRVISLQVQIQNMRISEKVRLASLGNKEARSLLVRDQNRLVHMAVMHSPKMTPPEYQDFAGNKNLSENVINYIANRKGTMRDYQLVLKLVANPKLHLRTATKMLNFMRPNDLKSLSKNRNVSPQLAKLAKNLLRKRNK